jgi:ribonuclease BN (tRNA processing enzyme)
MKRILIIGGLVVLVLVLAVVGVVAATFMGRKSIADGQDLGGGARVVADGFSGIAMIPVGEQRVLLVDAGQDTGGDAIRAALSRDGLSPDAVVAVLVTHGHADHTGALKLFPHAEIFSDSQADNVASLRRLSQRLSSQEAAVRAIVPAHSGPVDGLAPLAAFASATGP